jgi:hypothetical protein
MMFRSILLLCSTAALLSQFFGVVDAASDCTLSAPLQLDKDGDLTLQQIANFDEGTFTMKLTYTGGQAWIGIGINKEGRNKMTPSHSVIGRADGSPSVRQYSMTSKDSFGVNPFSSQTLRDASFEQTSSTSTLTFTKLLDDEDHVVTEDSMWIFAVGLPSNRWGGHHQISGSFRFPLTSCGSVAVDGMDSATTGDHGHAHSHDDDVSNGLEFFETTKPSQGLWIAHGIILAFAWGVCLPIGIGASLLRNALGKLSWAPEGLWYSIHFYMNMLSVVLTMIGVLIAVIATQKEGDAHFSSKHPKTGLSILVLVIVQALAAYFKPGMPASPPPPTKQQDEETVKAEAPGVDIDIGLTHHNSSSGFSESTEKDTKKAPTKSMQRIAWEYSHRLLGMALLGLAWYNCHTGIHEQVESWPESKDWTGVFWGITAGLSGTIIVLTGVMRK